MIYFRAQVRKSGLGINVRILIRVQVLTGIAKDFVQTLRRILIICKKSIVPL